MRARYFGCPRGVAGHREAGHGYYPPSLRGRIFYDSPEAGPWHAAIDAALAPREWDSHRAPEMPQGVAALHHKDGWTAIAFWDRSGDRRPNSNSAFLFDATLDFDTALAAAREHFPALFERFPFEVVPAELPAGPSEVGDV